MLEVTKVLDPIARLASAQKKAIDTSIRSFYHAIRRTRAFEDGSIEVGIACLKQWLPDFSQLKRRLTKRSVGAPEFARSIEAGRVPDVCRLEGRGTSTFCTACIHATDTCRGSGRHRERTCGTTRKGVQHASHSLGHRSWELARTGHGAVVESRERQACGSLPLGDPWRGALGDHPVDCWERRFSVRQTSREGHENRLLFRRLTGQTAQIPWRGLMRLSPLSPGQKLSVPPFSIVFQSSFPLARCGNANKELSSSTIQFLRSHPSG